MKEFSDFRINDFDGILAVGDVHGMPDRFERAVEYARSNHLFLLSLGDIVDYGPGTVKCVDIMTRLVAEDTGLMIQGNHEKKLLRYLEQWEENDIKIKIKRGLIATVAELNDLDEKSLDRFKESFRWLMSKTPLIARIDNLLFVHGGIETQFWVSTDKNERVNAKIRNTAFFGQVVPGEKRADGYTLRRYDWVNRIPKDRIVIAGHDILSEETPEVKENGHGGKAIFTDAGSGKGGRLLTVTFRKENNLYVDKEYKYIE